MAEDIPAELADKMMVKCGRRCCICRRFRPTKLQVHHIQERSKGGGNEEENLLVICLSCHTDVHTKVPFARRFSEGELKGHRDAVIRLVAEGQLPAQDTDDTDELLTALVRKSQRASDADVQLTPEASTILLTAVNAEGRTQGSILAILDSSGFTVNAGGKGVVHSEEGRTEAKYKRAIKQLSSAGLIEDRGFKGEIYDVTDEGYLLADEIMSRAERD